MLSNFFNPKSIALIGASRNSKKIGHTILKNIIDGGFKGKIYPINPSGDEILGYKSHTSILKVKNIDLAIIAIPAQFVVETIRESAEAGVKNLIIISAGFRETGSAGLQLEKEIVELAKKFDLSILGQNCLGLIDPHNNINASFAKTLAETGRIAFISPSGATCSALIDWEKKENITFSKFVSLGNMTVLNELDFLEYFIKDNTTKVVFAYLENFSDKKRFIEITKKLCSTKPLIILKSGKTEKGQSIAMSHTGAMAEDKNIIKGVLEQVNAIHCESLGEMFNLIKLLANIKIPETNNIAAIGNAGGINVITADILSESTLNLAKFEDSTIKKLQKMLPTLARVNNPLDIIGDADAKRYSMAIENTLKDKNVSTILAALTPQTVTQPMETAEAISKLSKKYKKNIITTFMGGEAIQKAVDYLAKNNIPNFSYPENAVAALEKFCAWKEKTKKNKKNKKEITPPLQKKEIEKIETLINGTTGIIGYNEAKNIMDVLQLPAIKGLLSSDLKKLNCFAQKIGYPIALKAISSSIIHKTDKGAVKLDINSPQEMVKAYEQLIKIAGKYKTKILIQPMISNAMEVIIGAKKDNKFGPIILFGLGGIYTEIFKDVSLRATPIDISDGMEMIGSLKSSKLFDNARGEKTDTEELARIIVKISQLISSVPNIKEIDLNPVMIKDGKIHIVDIRIIVE